MVTYTLAWAAATLGLAMIGNLSSHVTFNFIQIVAYWGGLIVLGLFVLLGMRRLAAYLVPDDGFAHDLVSSGLQALTFGPIIWAINRFALGFEMSGVLWVLQHVVLVLLICLTISLLRQGAWPGAAPAAPDPTEAPDEAKASPRPTFMDRLPEPLPGALRRVSANNHHLHVVTEQGEGRLLMRFGDAMVELEALPGFRIHRSHWVSEKALVAVRLEGRRHIAELSCGTRLPVSQAHLEALRDAGLLD